MLQHKYNFLQSVNFFVAERFFHRSKHFTNKKKYDFLSIIISSICLREKCRKTLWLWKIYCSLFKNNIDQVIEVCWSNFNRYNSCNQTKKLNLNFPILEQIHICVMCWIFNNKNSLICPFFLVSWHFLLSRTNINSSQLKFLFIFLSHNSYDKSCENVFVFFIFHFEKLFKQGFSLLLKDIFFLLSTTSTSLQSGNHVLQSSMFLIIFALRLKYFLS